MKLQPTQVSYLPIYKLDCKSKTVSYAYWGTGCFFCRYLVKFLAKLAQESEVNKMTPSNIAIVLGPNLLWAKTEG